MGRGTRCGGAERREEKCCIPDFIEECVIAGFGVVIHFCFSSLQVEALLFQLNPPLQLQCAQWLQSRCWMKPYCSPGRHQLINFRALSALCRELPNFSPATTPLVAVFSGRATHPANRAKRCESHFDLLRMPSPN